jgi:hypothetical protein
MNIETRFIKGIALILLLGAIYMYLNEYESIKIFANVVFSVGLYWFATSLELRNKDIISELELKGWAFACLTASLFASAIIWIKDNSDVAAVLAFIAILAFSKSVKLFIDNAIKRSE